MAKISLRAYNREIETMIERGQTNEAIGHCKHILKSFPKCLDTYRILGKSFLESQRYAEAADIFERILAAIPDDYIAHLGMSIIREDEGNLDAAIWHMERVFEVQPSNAAFQAELRRLYGRRDGIEPPKIRLTRGALVRMYAKGELFPQATAEIRAALAEDPKRVDLESILASVYFKAGRKVEATEICSRIVAKAPYNFEANRILSEILPTTSRADDALFYQARLQSMDPYTAYTNPEQPSSEDVPDQTVQLEHLDWQPSHDEGTQPAWTHAIGVQWEETEHDTEPDWLIAARQAESQNQDISAETDRPTSADALPDFLKGAGWTASSEDLTAQPESQLSSESEVFESPVTDNAELADADIPDWLAAMAPSESPQDTVPEEDERSEWLTNILGAPVESEPAPTTPAEVTPPDWLASSEESLQASNAPEKSAIPDWLADMKPGEETTIPDQKDVSGLPPEWLSEGNATVESSNLEAESGNALPDWLAELSKTDTAQEAAAETASLGSEPPELDWLTEINQQTSTESSSTEPAQDVPSWLAEMASEEPTASSQLIEPLIPENIESIQSAISMEAGLPIQPDLQADQISEEIMSDIPLESLTSLEHQVETVNAEGSFTESIEALDTSSVAELAEEPAQVSSAIEGPTESDIDSALAWLESLAVKQGADEDFLLVSEDKRTEQPPEWLANATDLPTAQLPGEEPEKADFSLESAAATPTDQSPDEAPTAAQQFPEWLSTSASATEQALQPESSPLDASKAPDWLTSDTTEPSSELETELPEWLSEVADQSQPETTPTNEESIPDWLAELGTSNEEFKAIPESEQSPVAEIAETPLLVDNVAEDELQAPGFGQSEIAQLAESEIENKLDTSASAVPSEGDIDSALAWLESLAVKQGADEDFLLVSADERTDTPPEWLSSTVESQELAANKTPIQEEPTPVIEDHLLPIGEEQIADIQKLETAEEIPAWLADVGLEIEETTPLDNAQESSPAGELDVQPLSTELEQELDITHPTDISSGLQVEAEDKGISDQIESLVPEVNAQDLAQTTTPTSESDIDSALAWLESLAVKQGADADFLFVAEADRTEKPPEWVEEAATNEEQKIAEFKAASESVAEIPELPQAASVIEEAPALTEDFKTQSEEEIPFNLSEAPLEKDLAPEVSAIVEAEPSETTLPETETVVSDWISAPTNQTEEEPESVEAWLSTIGTEEGTTPAVPEEEITAWEPVENIETSAPVAPIPSIEANLITADPGKALELAQAAMNSSNLDQSLEIYNTLITNNLNIEESIHNLREATYRFPINASLWQTLGDAYARNNALQDALDAYTKAEELLR